MGIRHLFLIPQLRSLVYKGLFHSIPYLSVFSCLLARSNIPSLVPRLTRAPSCLHSLSSVLFTRFTLLAPGRSRFVTSNSTSCASLTLLLHRALFYRDFDKSLFSTMSESDSDAPLSSKANGGTHLPNTHVPISSLFLTDVAFVFLSCDRHSTHLTYGSSEIQTSSVQE